MPSPYSEIVQVLLRNCMCIAFRLLARQHTFPIALLFFFTRLSAKCRGLLSNVAPVTDANGFETRDSTSGLPRGEIVRSH